MLWELLFASIVGFLAVVPLAHNTALHLPTTPHTWLISTAITGFLLGVMISVRLWRGYRKNTNSQAFSLLSILKSVSMHGGITLLALVTSSGYGLYQYQTYQTSLLNQPLTVTAQISSHQISDTISQQITTNAKEPIQIGTGYQRQIWQIDNILPFDKKVDNFPEDNSDDEENLATPEQDNPDLIPKNLPLQVLVTADLNRNPDWQTPLDSLKPSQSLTVKLALQPIAQPATNLIESQGVQRVEMGFDESAWLRQRGVQATAQLLTIDRRPPRETSQTVFSTLSQSIEVLRWQFRQKILTDLSRQLNLSHDNPKDQLHASAILLGLLTGDRGLMDSEMKHTYQVTGISHLLAISGPHVMMLASFIAFLVVAMVKRFFPQLLLRLPARLWVLWVSVGVSAWYALLVGFELPAQRTVGMLLLVTLSVQWLLSLSAYRVLAGVGLLMLWLDTTAVTQAGFWLSFVAVGLLLKFSQAFQNELVLESFSEAKFEQAENSQSLEPSFLTRQAATLWQAFKQLLWLQVWLFVLMMPVVIWFFGKISFLSIIVNLIAVPLLGLVIVPLDMLAGLLSFLPIIGTGLSQMLWQGLSWVLVMFHHGLDWLIDSGFAKQGYLSIRPSQLILLALAIGLWLLPKGLLPRLLTLPLLLVSVAVDYHHQHNPQNGAKLFVLDATKINISLWVKGDTAWLILADNRLITPEKPDTRLAKKSKIEVKPTNPNDILEQSIYPLLAKQGIKKLAGVVSQTPSVTVNAVVQSLSKEVRIEQYWLAGFDPILPNADFSIQGYDFSHITPKPCQAGQMADNISATTGWRLNPSQVNSQLPEPLIPKENWQTQACFIQIDSKKPVLMMAGNSQLPLQMGEQLCTVKPANLVIMPYHLPLTNTWLTATQAKQLHVITGKYANQQLSEDTQYAIADIPALETHQSGEQGSLVYNLE